MTTNVLCQLEEPAATPPFILESVAAGELEPVWDALPVEGKGWPVVYTLRVQMATGDTRLQTPENVEVGAT